MSGVMDYNSFIKNLRSGVFKTPVFLFFGPEQYLVKEALRFLTDHYLSPVNREFNFFKLDAFEIDDEILRQELNTLPFFSEYRVLVVEHAEKYFGTSKKCSPEEEEVLLNYLDRINESCCLVFVTSDKPDSRRKLFKRVKDSGYAVEFGSLKGAQLSRWLRGRVEELGKRISSDALNYLVAYTGNDLAILDHELQKLVLYSNDTPDISLETVKETISKTAGAGIFDLVDAVGEKKTAKAVDILRDMLAAGEAPVYILYMLARQYRLLLSVKSLLRQRVPEKQILSRLSLHPYVFQKILAQSKNFKERDLIQGLRYLLETDVGLKNSFAEPDFLLEMVIMKIGS